MPCLDMENGRVVKGIHFVHLKDAGDPVEDTPGIREREPMNSPCLAQQRGCSE